ncbi:MAG: hypothetical protein HY302_16560 [Opitutae bacterium]|nr:hypothetical protein [Opitutae bacterium]
MSEWWTYTPSNFLMFSARTYYRLTERLNLALWPAHLGALVAGVGLLALILRRPGDRTNRIAPALLAAGWLTVAWVYFWERYSTIHTAGRWFAAAFAVQALAMLWCGVVRARFSIAPGDGVVARAGVALLGFAIVVQPLAGRAVGRPWTQLEVGGLLPDPTVVATLGLLLAARTACWPLWIVPAGWGLFSGMTLWSMHSPEAGMLPAITVAAVALRVRRNRPATL